MLLSFLGNTATSFAAPGGGVIVEGNADITQNGLNTTITQHSHEALIQWETFDIE